MHETWKGKLEIVCGWEKSYLEVFYNKTELTNSEDCIRKVVLIDLWRKQISVHSMEGIHFICNYLILCFFPDISPLPHSPLCSKILLWIIITIIVIIQYIPVSQWHRSFCVSPLFYFSCYFFHAESVASVQIKSWSSFVRAKSSQQVMLWRRPSQTWQIINKTKKVKKKRVTKTETKKTGRGGKKKSIARRICVVNTALPLFLEVQFTFYITKLWM